MGILEINEFLRNINLPKNQILFLHVKLKGICNDASYQELSAQIIKVLTELYNPKTILVPTFTYNYAVNRIYDRINSSSEVGRFSEEIRKKFNPLHRTLNPVFNVIDTRHYLKNFHLEEESAFGEDSLMHLLHQLGHVVVNINLDEFVSTYIHFLEYHYDVPYRYVKNIPGRVIISDKENNEIDYKYFVRDLEKPTTWDRNKIMDTLFKEGGLQLFILDNLRLTWSYSKKMERILGKKLELDRNFLLK